jgi:hypothetical protein
MTHLVEQIDSFIANAFTGERLGNSQAKTCVTVTG